MMRLRAVLAVAWLLMRFFCRRVLHLGVLRLTAIRWSAAAMTVVLLTVVSWSVYTFLKPLVRDERVWDVLFETATASVVLWVLIAFLLVKTLFVNADAMLSFTHQLPVTNRERFAAVLLYELTMVGLVAGFAFIALVVASTLLLGVTALPRLVEAILVPTVLTYLAASLGFVILTRVFGALGLRRLRSVLAILVLFGATLAYVTHMGTLTSRMTQSYLAEQDDFLWVNAPTWVSDHYGFAVMFSTAVAATALAVMILAAATPRNHQANSAYLRLPLPSRLTDRLTPYDLCALRSSQTVLPTAVAVLLFFALVVSPTINPLWALSVGAIGAMYQYAQTEPLRATTPGPVPPAATYLALLRAQLLVAVPLQAIAVAYLMPLRPALVSAAVLPLVGHLATLIGCLSIGIAFPAEHDNPFSVFVGLGLGIVVVLTMTISVGLLQLGPSALGVMALVAVAAVLIYSINGIASNDSRRRNETRHHRPERSGRSTGHDIGARGRRIAVPDVHQQR